jgi:LemA protein
MITAVIVIWGLLFLAIIITYNSLVSARNGIENANGSLDAMLKKRYDLLPNLISIVKNYMDYEKSVLVEVTEMRTKRISGELSADEKHEMDTKIGQSMNSVLLSVENYPNLKADKAFSNLQASWNESEEQIAAARRAYNAAVTDYNNAFEGFPGNMFAKNMKFEHKQVIEIPEIERNNINAAELFSNSK